MKLLTVSGSLRARSTNTAVLLAIKRLAPPGTTVVSWDELAGIAPFNPDLDTDLAPQPVFRLRAALQDSDCILFSTPEYAHGIPGALKNALDWVVGSGELSGKPVALVNASVHGEYARAALRETLRAMNARLLDDAEVTIPLWDKTLNSEQIAANSDFASLLKASLQAIESRLTMDEARN